LRPDPVPTLDPDGDYLHRVWNTSVCLMARSLDRTLRIPRPAPEPQSLEVAEFARQRGVVYDTMHTAALFRAFFEDGQDIGRMGLLLEVGASVDLDRDERGSALEDGRFTGKVLADERLAVRLGIGSVPTTLVAPPSSAS